MLAYLRLPTSRGHSYYVSKDEAEARMSNCRRTTPPVVKKLWLFLHHMYMLTPKGQLKTRASPIHTKVYNGIQFLGGALSFRSNLHFAKEALPPSSASKADRSLAFNRLVLPVSEILDSSLLSEHKYKFLIYMFFLVL